MHADLLFYVALWLLGGVCEELCGLFRQRTLQPGRTTGIGNELALEDEYLERTKSPNTCF